MSLVDDLKSNFNTSIAQAQQAVGNNLFSFLGQSAQAAAENAGLELKTQFVEKIDEPDVADTAASVASGINPMFLIGGAVILGFFLLRSKKAG